jgi:DNA-binding MarR family transcriptional regulator
MPATKKTRSAPRRPSRADYEALAEFRYIIRRFLEFSQDAARATGLTPAQHQALLAIKGTPRGSAVTIGYLAEHLCIRHHSAVELANRLATAGLVVRAGDPQDHRRVVLKLTKLAERQLAGLSAVHLDELGRLGSSFRKILGLQRGRRRPPA